VVKDFETCSIRAADATDVPVSAALARAVAMVVTSWELMRARKKGAGLSGLVRGVT
jgi:hypothetical protein